MEKMDNENRKIVEEWLDVDSSVPTKVQRRLAVLLEENLQGINVTELAKLYKKKYNIDLHVLSYEATSVLQLVGKLKKIFRQVPTSTNIVLFPAFLPEGETEFKLRRQLDTTPGDVKENMKKILVKAKISNPTVGGIYYDEFLKVYEETYGTPLTFEKFNSFTFDEYISKQKQIWMKEGSYDGKVVLKYEIEEQRSGEKEYSLDFVQQMERSKFPPDVISPHEKLEFLDFEKEFKVGDTLEVFVPNVKSCDRFYIQLKKYVADLDDVESEMDLFYKSECAVRIPSLIAVSGVYCATYYKNKQNWYRVQIDEVSLKGICKCYYVDNGNRYNLNPKNLYYLSKKFGTLPMQAICASLAYAAPWCTYWSDTCTERFRSLTQGNAITAKVVSVDAASFNLHVELYAQGENILDILAEEKLAKRVEVDEEEEFFKISEENIDEIYNTNAEEVILDEKHSESNELVYWKDFVSGNSQDAGQNFEMKKTLDSGQQYVQQNSNPVYSSCTITSLHQSLPALPAMRCSLNSMDNSTYDDKSVEQPSMLPNSILDPLLAKKFNISPPQSSSFQSPTTLTKRYGSLTTTQSSPSATDSPSPPARCSSTPAVIQRSKFTMSGPPLYHLPPPTFGSSPSQSFHPSSFPRQPHVAPNYGQMGMWFPFQYHQPSPAMPFQGIRPCYSFDPYYQPYSYYPMYPHFAQSGWNASLCEKFRPHNYYPYHPGTYMEHPSSTNPSTVATPPFSINNNSLESNPLRFQDLKSTFPKHVEKNISSPPSKAHDVPNGACYLNNTVQLTSSLPSRASDILQSNYYFAKDAPSNQNVTFGSHEATSYISNYDTGFQNSQLTDLCRVLKPPPGFEDLPIESNLNGSVNANDEKKTEIVAQDIEGFSLRRPCKMVTPIPSEKVLNAYCESGTSYSPPCESLDEVRVCGKNLVKVIINDKAYFIVGQIMKNFNLTKDEASLFQNNKFYGDIYPSKNGYPQLYEKLTLEKIGSVDTIQEGLHLIPVHELTRFLYIAGVESLETILEAMNVVMEQCEILDLYHTELDTRLWDM